jgi:hypothetical protein
MGNITGKATDSDDEDQVVTGSMHSNMLRQMKHNDVFKKYKTMEVLVGLAIFNFLGCLFGGGSIEDYFLYNAERSRLPHIIMAYSRLVKC